MVKITHHERRTDIKSVESGELSAEFWNEEEVLYFQVDLFGLDVEEARRVAEFINLAAAELERFINERPTCFPERRGNDDRNKITRTI
jgi:hypothetical protein